MNPELSELSELFMAAGPFTNASAVEAAVLCRKHEALRSMVMFAMELVTSRVGELRQVRVFDDMRHIQGQCDGLERYVTSIINILKEAETPRQSDETEEQGS